MTSLADKVLIVTGAASGIGRATAELALAEGANVVAVDCTALPARYGAGAAHHSRLAPVQADLTDPLTPMLVVREAIDRFGRLDSLVNNAGIYPRTTIDTLTSDHFDAIIAVNLKAPLFLTQAVLAAMQESKRPGAIVNVGSINAYAGHDNLLAYSIAKAGLMAMSRNLANSLAGGPIRMNLINVGWTLTEGEDRVQRSLGAEDSWAARVGGRAAPLGRLLDPMEVARHILFWAGDASAPANGSVYELEQYSVLGRL